MRHLITLAESVGATDKAAICAKMVQCLVDGRYWDEQAQAANPGKFLHSDAGSHMAEYWEAGDFDFPFPERLHGMECSDIQDTPEFREFAMWWCEEAYDRVVARLQAVKKHGDKYVLYRVIRVARDWAAGVQRTGQTSLGIYWTYDKDSWDFEPIWSPSGMEGVNVVFHAFVDPAHIDWHYTIMAGMDWESGENEYEMRVLKGSPLEVFRVQEREDRINERDINLTNVTFTA